MKFNLLPHAPGVYLFRDLSGSVIYIGKAKDLHRRVRSYFSHQYTDSKMTALIHTIKCVDYIATQSEREALVLEQRLIQKQQPIFNSMWRDDKSYPYVQLTIQEDFPRLLLARKKQLEEGAVQQAVPSAEGALYFGPYPKSGMVKRLLRHLWRRKFFTLRPCSYDFSVNRPLDPKKIHSCIYFHTGECPAPCAGKISKNDYHRIAEKAIWFFEGKWKNLKKVFIREMKRASLKLQFEQAAQLRDNIKALDHVGEGISFRELAGGEVEERIGFSRVVSLLQKALLLKRPPLHIEAFDISNLFGVYSVGSMVCYLRGEPYHSHYRHFKIKSLPRGTIDDFAMIHEVVTRRYQRVLEEREDFPDLILIDGGKGQLQAALKAINSLRGPKPDQALVALAKREEEIYVPGRNGPIRLSRDSPALQLLQRIRDEAHRFAVSYHRKLRNRSLLEQ